MLSRLAVFQVAEGSAFPRKVTDAWVRPVTAGTVIELAPGHYTLRAQGTGDSFIEAPAEVKPGSLQAVTLGFATLVLDGTGLASQGRVRVWQKSAQGERIIVTHLVRPGQTVSIGLASGDYRIGFLNDGLTDEDANFTPFGGEIKLVPRESHVVAVTL